MNLCTIENLSKHYPKFSLQNVSFSQAQGRIMALIGKNGAGKSTVMKMLLNLVKPNSGEIVMFSKKVAETDFEILKKIGTIIENPYLYENLTAKQNLDLHCEYMGYYNKDIRGIGMCRIVKAIKQESFKIFFRDETTSCNS